MVNTLQHGRQRINPTDIITEPGLKPSKGGRFGDKNKWIRIWLYFSIQFNRREMQVFHAIAISVVVQVLAQARQLFYLRFGKPDRFRQGAGTLPKVVAKGGNDCP